MASAQARTNYGRRQEAALLIRAFNRIDISESCERCVRWWRWCCYCYCCCSCSCSCSCCGLPTLALRTPPAEGDNKIDAEELEHLFQELGHKTKRGEVEDMIWEVDEDCDGCISWLEFQNLYTRGRDDKTGYEPRGLFNVVEFVMNDKEGAGYITLEEAMQIMYLRYGR